jgi:MFS family permease
MNVVTGFFADKIGRRKMLVFYACITVLSGIVFAVIRYVPLLAVTAIATMFGSKRVMGPVDMLERVILAQSCSDEHRTQMYAIRNMLSSLLGALGFLFSGFPILLQNLIYVDQIASFRIMFVIYGMLAFIVLLLYSRARYENRSQDRVDKDDGLQSFTFQYHDDIYPISSNS